MRIDTRELHFWAGLSVFVAFWLQVVLDGRPIAVLTPRDALDHILDNGAFDVFAWGLVALRLAELAPPRPARGWQIVTAFLIGLLVLSPYRLATAAALAAQAFRLLIEPNPTRQGRQVAWLFLALAVESAWLSGLVAPLHALVAHLDAAIVACALRALGVAAAAHGNLVATAGSGFSIIIWPFCSASHPLAAVGLGYLVMTVFLDRPGPRQHWPWVGATFLSSIVLTEIRLTLLAWDQASYTWWHDGPGATIYTLAALGLAVSFPILAHRGWDGTRAAARGAHAA